MDKENKEEYTKITKRIQRNQARRGKKANEIPDPCANQRSRGHTELAILQLVTVVIGLCCAMAGKLKTHAHTQKESSWGVNPPHLCLACRVEATSSAALCILCIFYIFCILCIFRIFLPILFSMFTTMPIILQEIRKKNHKTIDRNLKYDMKN